MEEKKTIRETDWGFSHPVDLLQPLNTNTVNQDTFGFGEGGPAILNNGLNRDGGITELYEQSAEINSADYTFVASNGLILGLVDDGTVLATTNRSQITAPVYPGTTVYPSASLYPGGGYGASVIIGKLNAFNFFKKSAVPTYYLDCVVTSSTTVAGYTYTLVGIRRGGDTSLIIDELDPVTMQVLEIAGVPQSATVSVTALTTPPGVCIARSNTLTFSTVQTKGGFIYNVGTRVWYWRNGTNYDTGKSTDTNYQAFSCYYVDNTPTTVFTTTLAGSSAIWSSPAASNTWTKLQWTIPTTAVVVDGIMLGDSGANVLDSSKTAGTDTLTLVAMTASARAPNFVVTVSAAGAVAAATGWNTYFSGSGTTEATFEMSSGVVTVYGSCGISHDTGAYTHYNEFHLATTVADATADKTSTTGLSGLAYTAYPQLDVAHKMLRVRSYAGNIALLAGNTAGFSDTNDAGNIINDFAGGTFEYDLMSGSPITNGLDQTAGGAGARNFFFHPLSWRGATATTGVTVYRLNNGDFVAVNSTTTPQFTEIAAGVVAINTLSAWGAIIDLNTETMYYNYAAYTPSFRMDRSSTEVLCIKITNKYSSSLDQGIVGALYTNVSAMSTFPVNGWTVWSVVDYDSTTLKVNSSQNKGDYYANGSVAPYAPHNGSYFFNANVPPGGDAIFSGGGIQMLNAVAIQTPNYFGYFLFPEAGSSAASSNLLPWRDADIFLLQGTYYAYNNEYVYQVNLTNGSSGTVQGAPIAIAYAIGLYYLCVSPKRAYFLSTYDNSVYFFDGGRSLTKFFEANQKMAISSGAYNVRDNALYLQTSDSMLTLRDEQSGTEVNAEGLQITENELPTGFDPATDYIKSTSNGLFFIMGNTLAVRSYYSFGSLILMDYRTAHYSPAPWQTMQIGRITGQVYCTQNLEADLTLTLYYIRVDGTSGSVSATVTTATRNADGYARFSWTPSVSNVTAASVRIQHTTDEQKIVLMELVMYYKDGPEVIPLTEVAVEV